MKLNLITPLNPTSYGYVGSHISENLIKQDVDLAISIHPQNSFNPESRFAYLKDSVDRFNSSFHHDAPSLKIWHQNNLTGFIGRGLSFGWTIFELDQFTAEEIRNLEYPGHLIVCSEWAKNIVLNQTVREKETVHVVPLGVDCEIFKPGEETTSETTIFGNFGKWELRKGHDILINAFNSAFEDNDNVQLVMCPHNFFLKPHQTEQWVRKYKDSKLGDKVVIIPRMPDQQSVYNIMRQIDCGVFPSRGEGWNLELLELLAIGKQVIATDYSGHTEFCDRPSCLMINGIDEVEPAVDGVFFNGQGNWAKLNADHVDQLINHMRSVHQQKQNKQLLSNKKGVLIGQKHSWENVASSLINLIKDKTNG